MVGSNIFPVSLHFAGNMEQCKTCRLYGTHILSTVEQEEQEEEYEKTRSRSWQQQRAKPPPEWSCCACSLGENIWLCLLCSHAGCGRYTAQHAELHYKQTQHPFALELVTGRIWDYAHDTFVHAEDLHCEMGDAGEGEIAPASKWGDQTCDEGGETLSSSKSPGLGSPNLTAFFHAHPRLLRRRAAGRAGPQQGELNGGPHSKILSVQSEYEGLLESQLEAQRLFFDKMLAQETVRALELAFGGGRRQGVAALDGNGGFGLRSENYGGLDFGGLASEEDMAAIEQRKIDISTLEQQHTELLAAIRDTASDLRKMRKSNNSLIREQKMLREREAELIERMRQVTAKCEERTTDLEQQLADLTFFVRTRAQVESSALKGGSLVLRQRTPDQASESRRSAGAGGGSTGGSGRKK